MHGDLLSEIDAFLADAHIGEHRFGMLAAKNGRLVERLRAGTTPTGKAVLIRPETEQAIRGFIVAEREKRGLLVSASEAAE